MSPRGLEGVKQAAAEVEARRSNQGGPGVLWFRLQDGDEANGVRFLEQDEDVAWAWVHTVPVEGRQFGRPVPCCDQEEDGTPCPGCERSLQRKFQGYINLIWPEAPVFKRDSDGKLVRDSANDPVILDRKPQVAVWSSGIRLFEQFEELNTNYRGLTSRRFKVKRKGTGLSTKYSIAPEDVDGGPQEMSADEKKLAEEKPDLGQFVAAKTYEEFLTELGEGSSNGERDQAPSGNPFMRRRPA